MLNRSKRHGWLLIAAVLVALNFTTTLIVVNAISDTPTIISWVTGVIFPTIGSVIFILQKNSVRVFVFINKLKSLMVDNSPAWTLSAQWEDSSINLQKYERLIEELRSVSLEGLEITIQKLNKESHIVHLTPGPSIELSYTRPLRAAGGTITIPYVYLRIRNYRVTYRKASHFINSEIMPALERVNRVIGQNAKYSLTVNFKKDFNPFFGFYLSQLPKEAVSSFVINLDLSEPYSTNRVLISDEKLSIQTRSESALQNLAVEFLSLDYGLSRRL